MLPSLAHSAAMRSGCRGCVHTDDKPSAKLLGSFLMMSQLQHTQPTSAMWLTGAAPNTLALGLARSAGVALPAGRCVDQQHPPGLAAWHACLPDELCH